MHATTAQAKWTHMPRVGWSGTAGPGCCGSCGHVGQHSWDGGGVSIADLEPEPHRGTPTGQVAVDRPGNRHGYLRGTAPPAGRGTAGKSPRRGAGHGGPGRSRAEGREQTACRWCTGVLWRGHEPGTSPSAAPPRQHAADGPAPAPITAGRAAASAGSPRCPGIVRRPGRLPRREHLQAAGLAAGLPAVMRLQPAG